MTTPNGGMKVRMEVKLGQHLVMTQQLQQAIRMLQMSRLEMQQQVCQELVENPLLEEVADDAQEENASLDGAGESNETPPESPEGETDFDLKWETATGYDDYNSGEGFSADLAEHPSIEQTLTRRMTLAEHLTGQLSLAPITLEEREIGNLIIGNINDDGYLDASPEEIAAQMGVSVQAVLFVLKIVQGFDPTGVGAREIKECLLIQMAKLGQAGSLAEALIQSSLEQIQRRRFQQIAKERHVTVDAVLAAFAVIASLEPKPGRPFSTPTNSGIVPDLFVIKSEAGYSVVLNDDGLPKLKINAHYRQILRAGSGAAEADRQYVREKFKSAVWMVQNIERRNATIRKVGESIVSFQYEFMEHGPVALKPLILKQVADDISMHESTVSRVTNGKYMFTPQGIYELKFFFSNNLSGTSEDPQQHSAISVQEMLRGLISEEDPAQPLTDQEIVSQLKNKHNVEIARRTIAKYRALLNIPTTTLRKTP